MELLLYKKDKFNELCLEAKLTFESKKEAICIAEQLMKQYQYDEIRLKENK